ncbi:hypothetical protein D3C75_1195330 [compost metagenome]
MVSMKMGNNHRLNITHTDTPATQLLKQRLLWAEIDRGNLAIQPENTAGGVLLEIAGITGIP